MQAERDKDQRAQDESRSSKKADPKKAPAAVSSPESEKGAPPANNDSRGQFE